MESMASRYGITHTEEIKAVNIARVLRETWASAEAAMTHAAPVAEVQPVRAARVGSWTRPEVNATIQSTRPLIFLKVCDRLVGTEGGGAELLLHADAHIVM